MVAASKWLFVGGEDRDTGLGERLVTDPSIYARHCAIFWNLPRGVELDNLDKRCNLQFVLEMAPKPAVSSLGLVYEEVYVGIKPYAIL